MSFTDFDESNREQFDLPARKLMDRIVQKCGKVEFRSNSQREFCIRVVVNIKREATPLAAIGNGSYEAADRLLRILKTVPEE